MMAFTKQKIPALLIALLAAALLAMAVGVMTTQSAYAADKQLDKITFDGKTPDEGAWPAHAYALDGKKGTLTLEEMGIGAVDKKGNAVPADALKVSVYRETGWSDKTNQPTGKLLKEPYGLVKGADGYSEGWGEFFVKVRTVSGKGYKGELLEEFIFYDKHSLNWVCSTVSFKGARTMNWRMMEFAIVPKSKAAKPVVKTIDGKKLKEGRDYTVTYRTRVHDAQDSRTTMTRGGKKLTSMPKKTGKYYLKIKGKGDYYGGNYFIFDIATSSHPTYVAAGTTKSKPAVVKYKKVRKAKQTISIKKLIRMKNGAVALPPNSDLYKVMKDLDPPYTKVSGNKKITVNPKNGKVTVKKGLKKGIYTVKIKVQVGGIYRTFYEGKKQGAETVKCYIRVK